MKSIPSLVLTPISRSPCREIGADEHGEVVEDEYSDRMAVSVDDVLVVDAVLACTREDHGVHAVKLS
jgi:hypothetical protein